jgi:hypothetical protein
MSWSMESLHDAAVAAVAPVAPDDRAAVRQA